MLPDDRRPTTPRLPRPAPGATPTLFEDAHDVETAARPSTSRNAAGAGQRRSTRRSTSSPTTATSPTTSSGSLYGLEELATETHQSFMPLLTEPDRCAARSCRWAAPRPARPPSSPSVIPDTLVVPASQRPPRPRPPRPSARPPPRRARVGGTADSPGLPGAGRVRVADVGADHDRHQHAQRGPARPELLQYEYNETDGEVGQLSAPGRHVARHAVTTAAPTPTPASAIDLRRLRRLRRLPGPGRAVSRRPTVSRPGGRGSSLRRGSRKVGTPQGTVLARARTGRPVG